MDMPAAIEPSEWFVVFHRKSANRILSFLAFGEFKHVSIFGYCAGVKLWLLYDVHWNGTRLMLLDKQAVMEWSAGCDLVKIARFDQPMGMTSRAGLYCVSAIKHLLRLRCVAATPDQLYRHILQSGGILVREHRQQQRPAATSPGGPDARPGADAGAERPDQVALERSAG